MTKEREGKLERKRKEKKMMKKERKKERKNGGEIKKWKKAN